MGKHGRQTPILNWLQVEARELREYLDIKWAFKNCHFFFLDGAYSHFRTPKAAWFAWRVKPKNQTISFNLEWAEFKNCAKFIETHRDKCITPINLKGAQ